MLGCCTTNLAMTSEPVFDIVSVFDALKTNPRLGASLTGDEVKDNALVAVLILVIATLIRDIIARVVYFKPRFSTSNDSLSYYAQSRMSLFDDLSRRVWRPHSFNPSPATGHRYIERNRNQWMLVLLAAAILVMFELSLTVLALPASNLTNAIKLKSTNIIGFYISGHENESGLLQQPSSECTVTPLFDAPNVKSNITWSWCHHKTQGGRLKRYNGNNTRFEATQVKLRVNHKANAIEAFLVEPSFKDGKNQEHAISMRVFVNTDVYGTLIASVQSTTRELVDSFLRNANLTRSKTGLDFQFNRYNGMNSEVVEAILFVNASAAKDTIPVYEYVILLMGGCIDIKPNGSRLIQVGHDEYKNGLELKGEIQVAEYVGTMLSPKGALILTTIVLLVDCILRAILRGPPGVGWELLTAHGRLCTDALLSGPEEQRVITKSRNGDVCYIGFGLPPGFVPVENFNSDDNVSAAPLAEVARINIGIHSLSQRAIHDVDYWEYETPFRSPNPRQLANNSCSIQAD